MIESSVMPHRPEPVPNEVLKEAEVKVIPPKQPEPAPDLPKVVEKDE